MNASTAIPFAVVGLGRIGGQHARQILETDGFELAAICDPSQDARQSLLQDCKDTAVDQFEDFEKLLASNRFQWVVIATPSHLHKEMTVAALEAGYHVLVEKPMASSASDALRMVAAAHRCGRFLTVHQSVRYQPDTKMIRRVIDSGVLGDVFQVYRAQHGFKERDDWQIWEKYAGGAVANIGSHLIDAAMLMISGQPEKVWAWFDRILDQGDTEDCYKIIVRFDGGQIVESEFLRSYFGKGWWHVCGTHGSVCIDDSTLPVITMRVKTVDGKEWTEDYDFREDKGNIVYYYADLAKHLLAGREPPIEPSSVVRQLQVIDAARQSNEQGCAVAVPASQLPVEFGADE